jgi:hypothetical protein
MVGRGADALFTAVLAGAKSRILPASQSRFEMSSLVKLGLTHTTRLAEVAGSAYHANSTTCFSARVLRSEARNPRRHCTPCGNVPSRQGVRRARRLQESGHDPDKTVAVQRPRLQQCSGQRRSLGYRAVAARRDGAVRPELPGSWLNVCAAARVRRETRESGKVGVESVTKLHRTLRITTSVSLSSCPSQASSRPVELRVSVPDGSGEGSVSPILT